jgi:hypothetical protein
MTQYWYDTIKQKVVDDEERGSSADLLGPYPTREAAENWRATRDAREAAWGDDDEDG